MARKILLADDSVTAQNMGRKILADAGYEVITVNNGSAALKKIADTKPDIIILDVYMPGYSGLEVCQRLKDAQETSRIPVLLTVGKLEPFKPEEAKRVRAEGYIVKPFEASELLSTLSKLEDKIVPRAEASKPGRFARANAALDEGKYDKSVAIEEDTGWKNRIGFPSKNKKAASEDEDDSTIYNAVNKDLKTVVERKWGQEQREAKKDESRFDLGALAPEGLPNNVTPEEIAALAAAAAQVKGSLAESAATENLPDLPAAALADAKAAEVAKEVAKEVPSSEVAVAEAKAEAVPAAEPSKESEVPAATFAAQKPEEPAQPAAAKLADAVQDSGVSVPSPAEMMAAIAGLVPDSGRPSDASSGNGTYTSAEQSAKEKETVRSEVEPVTMAAAAGAGSATVASRWTAVAVALAPEESSISLEQEMQKAHAAFAAADAPAAITPASAAVETAVSEISSPAKVEEPVVAAAHEPEMARSEASPRAERAQPEIMQNEVAPAEIASVANSVSSPATEAVSAAVREFERVATSFVAPQPQALPEPQPETPAVESGLGQASASPSVPEVLPVVEPAGETVAATAVQSESTPTETASAPVYDFAPAPGQESPVAEEAKFEELKSRESKFEESKAEESKLEAKPVESADGESATEESKRKEWKQSDSATVAAISASAGEEAPATADKIEPSVPDFEREIVTEKMSGIPLSSIQLSSVEQEATPVENAGGTRDIAKKESEIAETTAAAWASWRRIRETGDSKNAPAQPAKAKHAAEEEKSAAHDESAMAVAAGAENNSEATPAAPQDTGEIASIVDSMLADLRPKMMEEITRKLGKKK